MAKANYENTITYVELNNGSIIKLWDFYDDHYVVVGIEVGDKPNTFILYLHECNVYENHIPIHIDFDGNQVDDENSTL
jgi:hypothetical protein